MTRFRQKIPPLAGGGERALWRYPGGGTPLAPQAMSIL